MKDTTRKAFTVKEVAEILGLGLNSTYSAVHRGEIPSLRIGNRLLVPSLALERLLVARDDDRRSPPADGDTPSGGRPGDPAS